MGLKTKSPDSRSGRERENTNYKKKVNGCGSENQGLPPRCIESEQVFIGSVLKNGILWGGLKGQARPAAFYDTRHAEIVGAFHKISDAGIPIDILTLLEHFRKEGDGYQAGTSSYWTHLMELAAPIIEENLEYHLNQINNMYHRRLLWECSHRPVQAIEIDDTERVQRLLEKISELQSRGDNAMGNRLNPVSAAELPDVEPPESLWGGLLYPGTVTQLNAEPGAGKSTLAYNLADLGAQGQDFLGEPFPKAIKVLYVDLETPAWLRRTKIETICGELPGRFYLLDDMSLSRDVGDLISVCKAEKYDLVILDTQAKILDLDNENDNSEANRAGRLLDRIKMETGAAILLIHHTKKGEGGKGVYRGRGASAIAGSVDIVCNLEVLDLDTLKLSVAKTRIPAELSLITMKKLGNDRFERVAIEETNIRLELYSAQDFIVDLLSDGMEWRTSEIQEGAEREGFTKRTVARAIKRLREAGKIYKIIQGVYALSGELLNTDKAPIDYPEIIAP